MHNTDTGILVLLFGRLAESLGTGRLLLMPASDTDTLLAQLKEKYPALQHAEYITAVNGQVTRENKQLQGNETIALMPPFSGG